MLRNSSVKLWTSSSLPDYWFCPKSVPCLHPTLAWWTLTRWLAAEMSILGLRAYSPSQCARDNWRPSQALGSLVAPVAAAAANLRMKWNWIKPSGADLEAEVLGFPNPTHFTAFAESPHMNFTHRDVLWVLCCSGWCFFQMWAVAKCLIPTNM